MAVHSERLAESLSTRAVDFKSDVESLTDMLSSKIAGQTDRLGAEISDRITTL
jgi:hypothetical protein